MSAHARVTRIGGALSAAMLCREAVTLLSDRRRGIDTREHVPSPPDVAGVARITGPPGNYSVGAFLMREAFDYSLDVFTAIFLAPWIATLAAKIPADTVLSAELLELPQGVLDAAVERYDATGMRCVIGKTFLPPGMEGMGAIERLYDVTIDEFVEDRHVGIMLRFDVCDPTCDLVSPRRLAQTEEQYRRYGKPQYEGLSPS